MLTKEQLERFKEQHMVVIFGIDNKGNEYSTEGRINAASWIGENVNILLNEINRLQYLVDNKISTLDD